MHNQQMGGLLGGMGGGQMQQGGGLLGAGPQAQAGPPQAQQSPQNQQMAMQMAQALAQSPTPQTAQQIVAAIQKMGNTELDPLIQAITQSADNPEGLTAIANAVMKAFQK